MKRLFYCLILDLADLIDRTDYVWLRVLVTFLKWPFLIYLLGLLLFLLITLLLFDRLLFLIWLLFIFRFFDEFSSFTTLKYFFILLVLGLPILARLLLLDSDLVLFRLFILKFSSWFFGLSVQLWLLYWLDLTAVFMLVDSIVLFLGLWLKQVGDGSFWLRILSYSLINSLSLSHYFSLLLYYTFASSNFYELFLYSYSYIELVCLFCWPRWVYILFILSSRFSSIDSYTYL